MCVHHWLIEPADGPTSDGTCRACHEHRTFVNTPPEATLYEQVGRAGLHDALLTRGRAVAPDASLKGRLVA